MIEWEPAPTLEELAAQVRAERFETWRDHITSALHHSLKNSVDPAAYNKHYVLFPGVLLLYLVGDMVEFNDKATEIKQKRFCNAIHELPSLTGELFSTMYFNRRKSIREESYVQEREAFWSRIPGAKAMARHYQYLTGEYLLTVVVSGQLQLLHGDYTTPDSFLEIADMFLTDQTDSDTVAPCKSKDHSSSPA